MAKRRSGRHVSGREALRGVRRMLARGWPAGLTVLSGEDAFHLDAALETILAALVPSGGSDLTLTVYSEGKADAADVVAAARSMPMFAPRRVVVVRDVAVLQGEPEPIAGYAAGPPPDSHLLVRASKLDLRRNLHKTLAEAGLLVRFEPRPSSDVGGLAREAQEMAAERGLTLDRGVAAILVEACGADLYRVRSELDKLDAWLGPESRRVDARSAELLLSRGGLMTGWEVANAVLARDTRAAVAAVRRLVESGDDPIRMVGGLAWRARVMLQAKALSERGVPEARIVAAARGWAIRRELLDGVGRYSMDELLAFPARLRRADRTLKSSGIDPGAALEALVRDLTGEAPPAGGRR